jgi:hypothetical protein
MTVLKGIATLFSQSPNALKKELLFNCIQDSPHVTNISDTAFKYRQAKTNVSGRVKIPTWILLIPEEVPPVAGVDMGTGAQIGFFGPANQENAVGATRSNFLTLQDERIQRQKFGPKREKKRKASDNNPAPPREDGHPSDFCRMHLPYIYLAQPKDFFDTQIIPKFLGWATMATNLRAYSSGAGSGEHQDFLPFDLLEVYKMIGVLFANGPTPKPQFDYWFCLQDEKPLFGSNKISKALNWKNLATGKMVKAGQSWKHFRRYFTLQDYWGNPRQQQRLNPLWKVQHLINKLNKQAKDMWVPGIFVAIDEQTIGFQGQLGMKLRISYKQEGDGFQCDAVCDSGYTFSFYFCHGLLPNLDDKFKHLDLSLTA